MEEISVEVLEAICDVLPVDLTFIDENDSIRYYNQNDNRVHKRTPEHIGTTVQECHLEANRPRVNEIMSELKAGKKGITRLTEKNGRKLWHGYLRVSDRTGRYIGALEVTQDITEICKLA